MKCASRTWKSAYQIVVGRQLTKPIRIWTNMKGVQRRLTVMATTLRKCKESSWSADQHLKLSQRSCFWDDSVVGLAVSDVSKDRAAFPYKGNQSYKMKAARTSNKSLTTHPTTQCHFPENLNLQLLDSQVKRRSFTEQTFLKRVRAVPKYQ